MLTARQYARMAYSRPLNQKLASVKHLGAMVRLPPEIALAHRELASRLASARTVAGITQTELALTIGRDQTFISKVENEERRLGVIEFVQITDALRADPLSILNAVSNALRKEN